jgi:phosphate acetyltransferase
MAGNLYIASLEANSGKLVVTLGIMEMLSRRVGRLGFFRTISPLPAKDDTHVQLFSKRYSLSLEPSHMIGLTNEEVKGLIGAGKERKMFRELVNRFKQAEEQCDFLLCEGPDITHLSDAFDYDISIRIARELGTPSLYVSSGYNKSKKAIVNNVKVAKKTFSQLCCPLLAVIVNRVNRKIIDQVETALTAECGTSVQISLLPEMESLSKPTMGEIVESLQAKYFSGTVEGLHRTVRNIKVAAMEPANFLNFLAKDDLIITPGDRADIIFATTIAIASANYPSAVGIILSGGLEPAESVKKILSGLDDLAIPIYTVKSDTFHTAMDAAAVLGEIRAGNERKIARATGMFESHVDTGEMEEKIRLTPSSIVSPLMFEYSLFQRARQSRKHIVLPEGGDDRILQAAELLCLRDIVKLTILGDEGKIRTRASALGLRLAGVEFIDPHTSQLRDKFAGIYFKLRKHKRITIDMARDSMADVSYFGTMMVYTDMVDGMVSGVSHTTAHTIRPAFQIIRTLPDALIVSSVFFMCMATRVLVYGDCAINPNPNSEQLADIAINAADTAKQFGVEPVVAMLSYSSGSSGSGDDVEIVRGAVEIAKQRRPALELDGPIQYDAAIDADVARKKMPGSKVAGRATVFIFPDLNTGNNTYKAVQRASGAIAIGPILQGLKKPVNDLSRGCTVPDIINTVAITAIQAEKYNL